MKKFLLVPALVLVAVMLKSVPLQDRSKKLQYSGNDIASPSRF